MPSYIKSNLKRLLLQREWTDEFLQHLSRVGRMHTNKAGSASINVDYIHINATLTYIETLLVDSIWKMQTVDDKTKKLNQFHVWFPGGIVIGGLLVFVLDRLGYGWRPQMAAMLIPTLIYGILFFRLKDTNSISQCPERPLIPFSREIRPNACPATRKMHDRAIHSGRQARGSCRWA